MLQITELKEQCLDTLYSHVKEKNLKKQVRLDFVAHMLKGFVNFLISQLSA